MTLDDIKPSKNTKMTKELVRLFKWAGCAPTRCHACQKIIKIGFIFKLVPHKKAPYGTMTDEMCCSKCGEEELVKRDIEVASQISSNIQFTFRGGYSRPSKVEDAAIDRMRSESGKGGKL